VASNTPIIELARLSGASGAARLAEEVGVKRGARLALGLAAVAIGGGETALLLADARGGLSVVELVLSLLAGWAFIGSGLVAWSRRPDNRTGPLMVLVGLTFLAGLLHAAEQPAVHTLGAWVRPLHLAVFTHLLLAFPSGRLDSPLARGLVAAIYLDLGLLYHAPLVLGMDGAGGTLSRLSFAIGAVVFLWASALLVYRWRAGSRAWRRAVAPLLWTGALALALLAVFNADQFFSRPVGAVPMWAFRVAFVTIPFAFLAVLLRMRLARASVAELVVELEEARPSGALRDALARALGDPSLAVAYWLPDQGRYVDLDGQPVELPGDGDDRMAAVVERDGRRVAAIVHDRALSDDPGLIRAAGAAAALALDNERLQAELRARFEELQASRARIVEAADQERRRIERNLHDGTQQRLTSVALALGLAESKLVSDPQAARASVRQAKQALETALAELRDLSHGIHPSVLTTRGLGPALEDLAYTAPLPVTVATELNGRLPERVEAGAYYAVAEGLANIAKHAHASTASVLLTREHGCLRLRVCDDGIGGADPARGSGLRGLNDRLQALGGTLEVESPAGRGTELRVAIPCA
jgi:signal transduction histidine kinase